MQTTKAKTRVVSDRNSDIYVTVVVTWGVGFYNIWPAVIPISHTTFQAEQFLHGLRLPACPLMCVTIF